MKSLKCVYCLVCLTLSMVLLSCSESTSTPAPIVIENPFIKVLPPGKTVAAAYMAITNNTDITQAINYVYSPIAETVEVHRVIYNEGMMQMRPVKKLSINPGETQLLEPGGFHLMVFGIYDTLKEGDSFELNFEFESGEKLTTRVQVKP